MFKEGDKVKIVANFSGHHFDLGEEVTLLRSKRVVGENVWFAVGLSGHWFVTEKEVV